MLFVSSKLLSAITQPMFWLAMWWFVALLLLTFKRRYGLPMLWAGLVVFGLLGFRVIPDALLRPLENRYPIPTAERVSDHAGVIVLGGSIEHPDSYLAHGQIPLGSAAERMTVPIALLRQNPKLMLVYSGGDGRLLGSGLTESEMARVFYQEQGVSLERILLEDQSRNTRENAQYVAKLLGERCKMPWLLVTSASHMPRSMAEFSAVGCQVTPYPVDFLTGHETSLKDYSLANSLLRW